MYGSSGKLGRGRGGGGGARKRNIHATPINRPSPTAPSGRTDIGDGPSTGLRGRGALSTASSGPSTSAVQAEESFSLIMGNSLNFAMAIRLTPDLVEEIKRVEANGGKARIKFDANANNSNGNVINVGDKIFKFTWSREMGELCDLYEERQSGDGGNGLLVESGGAWRKLNVHRVLDESTKNHVKMRSEEAERKLKSRKAIVLDHLNPSTKNQMKALAAAESNPCRMPCKPRKDPPSKKPRPEPPPGAPPKSAYKSGLSTTTPSKVRSSFCSPLPSQLEQYAAPVSPIGSRNLVKGHASGQDVASAKNLNKTTSSNKEMPGKMPTGTVHNKPKHNGNMEPKPADLRSLIISLLMEHHSKGMSLEALKKAIGNAISNPIQKIESILKQVATFQAPGIYFLKPGMEIESFMKPPNESGSFPEINRHSPPAPDKSDRMPSQGPCFSMRTAANKLEEQVPLNSSSGHTPHFTEKVNTLHNSPVNFSNKKVYDNSEGVAGSSSDTDCDNNSESDSSDGESDSSDSESDSSDSGSHSRSKSQSLVGSHSGSSSDSEIDASSSSKLASDEDVDILTRDDDNRSRHQLRDSMFVLSKSPVQWRHPDTELVGIGHYEMQDDLVSDVVEIEKESPEDDHGDGRANANYSVANKKGGAPVQEINSADHHVHQEMLKFDRNSYGGPDSVVNNGFKLGQCDEGLLKGNSKRLSDDKHSDERLYNSKRFKGKNSSQSVSGSINSCFESPPNSSLDRPQQGNQTGNITAKNGANDPILQIGFNQGIPISDSQQPGQTSLEERRHGKHDSLGCGVKYTEEILKINEGLWIQKGINTEVQNEDGLFSETRPSKFSAEGGGDKHATMAESHYRKSETMAKIMEAGPHSNSYTGHSSKANITSTRDRSPVMNGNGSVLRREHLAMELGESFRDEIPGPRKQYEKKSSFKTLENKPADSQFWISDSSRGKPLNKITADSRKLSPLISNAVVSGIPDRPSKRKAPEHYGEDLARPHNRATRPLPLQHQFWADHTVVGPQHNKVPEWSSESRYSEAGTGLGKNLVAYGDTSKKVPASSTEQQHDPKQGVVPHPTKESKKQKPCMTDDLNDRRKDDSLSGSNDGGQNRRESSSDENSCSFTKYEKEEPELKGPIKDPSEYKEYVKEYQEKYESYCSLNKILESYRDEFSKLGKELGIWRGRDMKRYHHVLGQMRSSFLQCGERHKRLKKIFIVLYEELTHLKHMIKDCAASYKKD